MCCGIFLYYFRHWQTANGRRVVKERVRKVEEEAGCGKLRNESQCERGYRGEDDVCSGNFIYYFSRNSAPAAAKHLLLVGFRRADWPTVCGSVQVCCGIFFLIILGTGKRKTVEE